MIDWSSDVCSSDLGERRRLLQQQVRGRQRVHRPRRRRRRKAETGPKQQHGKPENRRAAVHAGEATAKALPDRQAGGTGLGDGTPTIFHRSEEHTSELQSLMRISYAVFCLKKKNTSNHKYTPLYNNTNITTTL